MHVTRSIFLPAAALAVIIGTAHAADNNASRDVPNFNQMDKNNDGALTRSEASGNPRLLAHFDQVDDNGDGRLSRGEYLAVMARRDLYTVRDSLAEFIDPEGKPPLAVAKQAQGDPSAQGGQTQPAQKLPMAASTQLVRNVQNSLEAKGIDAGPVDGIWGPRTHQALHDFQDKHGLEATGQLDARTLDALGVRNSETGSAGSASAGASGGERTGEQSSAPRFEQVDKDNDGYVSRGEFNSTLGANQAAR